MAHCTCMARIGEACSHDDGLLFTLEANTSFRCKTSCTRVVHNNFQTNGWSENSENNGWFFSELIEFHTFPVSWCAKLHKYVTVEELDPNLSGGRGMNKTYLTGLLLLRMFYWCSEAQQPLNEFFFSFAELF